MLDSRRSRHTPAIRRDRILAPSSSLLQILPVSSVAQKHKHDDRQNQAFFHVRPAPVRLGSSIQLRTYDVAYLVDLITLSFCALGNQCFLTYCILAKGHLATARNWG